MNRVYFKSLTTLAVSVVLCVACSKGESKKSHTGEETSNTMQSEVQGEQISVDDATRILDADQPVKNGCMESFEPYLVNNALFRDPESPCNQGVEPLQDFIIRFSSDVKFQKARTRLIDEVVALPEIEVDEFVILEPDSSSFFASWHEIEESRASFCSGWLNSEMEQEFVFERTEEGLWYLTDYIGPMM